MKWGELCVFAHREHLWFQLFQSKGLASQNSPGHPLLSISVRAADCQLTHRNFSWPLRLTKLIWGLWNRSQMCISSTKVSTNLFQPQVSGGDEVWGGVRWCGVDDEDRLWDTPFTRIHVQSRAPGWLAGPPVWRSLNHRYHSGSILSHWVCRNGSLGHQGFQLSQANEWVGLDASATGNLKTTKS